MSKAFVIKNKEGEYLQFFDTDSDDIGFTDDLTLAALYDKNEKDIMEKAYSNMGWEYAEITIAEGDLQKENEVLHRALELACEELRDEYCRNCDAVSCECEMEMCDHVWNMYPKQEFIEKAKEQRDD